MTQQVNEEVGRYRFEPSATFFYEDLFGRPEHPPSPLRAVLSKIRAVVGVSHQLHIERAC